MSRWTVRAIAILSTLGPVCSGAAPLTFNTALPVAKGEFVLRELFVYSRSGDDPSGLDRRRDTYAFNSVIGYGIRGDVAAFLVVPFVHKRLRLNSGSGRIVRSASGLGDVSAFARYTVFKRDGRGWTFRVAPFAGLKMPTGRNERRDSFGRQPSSVQSGTGSWDSFFGVVATYQTLEFQIDGQASYRVNSAADGFSAGDLFRADVSFQYRLLPRRLTSEGSVFLYGVVELALKHQNRNRIGGSIDRNSGGAAILVTPALQLVTRRVIVELGVQLPVHQNFNGTALHPGVAVLAGFRVNF